MIGKIFDTKTNSPISAVVEACTNNISSTPTAEQKAEGKKIAVERIGRLFESGELKMEEHYNMREVFEHFCDASLNDSAKRVAEAIHSSGFAYITSRALAPITIEEYKDGLSGADNLVTEIPGNSDLRDVPVPGMTAADGLDLVGDGETYPQTTLKEKYCLIENFNFGKIIVLTKQSIAFDKTGDLISRARGIANKAGTLRHQIIVQKTFGIACTATREGATNNFRYKGTAASIFSNDHTAIDGVTNDNISTTAFSYDGLKALWLLLMKQKDEAGDYINTWPDMVVVPNALYEEALRTMNSQGRYDTANRSDNQLAKLFGKVPMIFTSPVLDDASTSLYYLGSPRKQTVWVWARRFQTETRGTDSDAAFDSDRVFMVKISFMGNAGSIDYRHIVRGGS